MLRWAVVGLLINQCKWAQTDAILIGTEVELAASVALE